MDIEEPGWKGVDWDDLTQDRNNWSGVMNTVIYILVQQDAGYLLNTCRNISLSRRTLLHGVS